MRLHRRLCYPMTVLDLLCPFFGGSKYQPQPSACNRDIFHRCNRGRVLHLLALSDLSALTYSLLFTLIVLQCLLWYTPLFWLLLLIWYSIYLTYFFLLSSLILLLHYAPPRFSSLATSPFRSNLLCSFPSALPDLIYSLHLRSDQLLLINSCSALIDLICNYCLDWLILALISLSFAPLSLLIDLKITYH